MSFRVVYPPAIVCLAMLLQACGALPAEPTATAFRAATEAPRTPTRALPPAVAVPPSPTEEVREAVPTLTDRPMPTVTPLGGGAGQLAFVSDRDGNQDVYVMALDGSEVIRLTSDGSNDNSPAWSPDGQRIAFASERSGGGAIYVMRADGEGVEQLTPSIMIAEQPAWSPDGTRIAFNCDVDIFPDTCTVAPDGGSLTRITTHGNHAGLDWSPDGLRLVFAANKGPTVELFMMLASGDDERRLTENLATDLEPAWSPDGRWIAFSSNREGRWGIYVMTVYGTSARRLTFTDADPPGGYLLGNSGSPAWSPDGQWIAYVAHQDGNREIYIMRSDGSEQTRLTWNDAADWSPAWRP